MPLKINKRGDFWHISGTVNGHRVRESTRTTDRVVAEAIKAKRQWELEQSRVFGTSSVLTFGAAVAKYLDAGGSERFLLPLMDRWENRLVSEIKPGEVRLLAREVYPTASTDTWRRQVVVPVRAVINCCADQGLCQPLRVRAFSKDERRRQNHATGRREYRATAVGGEWIAGFRSVAKPNLGALALFMFTTGARIGEAVDLTWDDLDLQEAIAQIRVGKNGGEIGLAYLTSEMVAVLANLDGTRRVFGYSRRHSVYAPWKKACAMAGLDYIPPHQAGRHSFATAMIVKAGADVATTARLGRYKSTRLLVETYTHGDDQHVIESVFGNKLAQSQRK